MELSKQQFVNAIQNYLVDPKDQPVALNSSGCCSVQLFTRNSQVLSRCIKHFEHRVDKERNVRLPSAPTLNVITIESHEFWSFLNDAMTWSTIPWESSLSKATNNTEEDVEQQVLRTTLSHNCYLVWNNFLKIFYVINAESRSIYVIGKGNDLRLHVAVIYAIREHAMLWIHQQSGWIPLHASAVVTRGHGIIFLGDKKAGKTTTVLNCLSQGGFSYIANDRVFLAGDQSESEIIGFPYWISIRQDTVKYFPKLNSIEIRDKDENQVLNAFGAERYSSAKLSLIFFINFDSTIDKTRISKLSPEETQEQLKPNLLSQELNLFRVIPRVQSEPAVSHDIKIERIAKSVCAYRLSQNIDNLTSTVHVLNELLADINITNKESSVKLC